mmetsp:Transcript_96321/g.215690  ORF Transcript_96321/g.215690 Transcript_96321/m.215690 type:complete len:304 (-) Transcript_96321:69-980(-)
MMQGQGPRSAGTPTASRPGVRPKDNSDDLLSVPPRQMKVKNTFLEVVDEDKDDGQVGRANSDPELRGIRKEDIYWPAKPKAPAAQSPEEDEDDGNSSTGNSDDDSEFYQARASSGKSSSSNDPGRLASRGPRIPLSPGPLQSQPRSEALSVGTELHGINCKPCSFVHTKTGCLNGSACSFCHAEHKRKSRMRPSKGTRTHLKTMVSLLGAVFGDDNEGLEEASQALAAKSSYMTSIIRAKLRGEKDGQESVTTTTTRSSADATSLSGTSQSGSFRPVEVGRRDVGGKGKDVGRGGRPDTKVSL